MMCFMDIVGKSSTPAGRLSFGLVLVLVMSLTACSTGWVPEPEPQQKTVYRGTPDGSYRVRSGDTLYGIAFDYKLDWKDLARWNGIESPYVIRPGQELRLTGPARSATVTTRAAGPGPAVSDRAAEPETQSRPAPTDSQVTSRQPASEENATVKPAAKEPVASGPSTVTKSVAGTDPSSWRWPVKGRILSSFRAGDPARNGIEIAGTEGQPIIASAPGEVVYSGNGLIGYGELIIIKHSERMLSAYAHNRKRLVSEGQKVASGEQIAEMGRDERNRAMLHFEIRRDGTPQDPLSYLP